MSVGRPSPHAVRLRGRRCRLQGRLHRHEEASLGGSVKVGQFKEPFSLEELTSSNYITFMERATPNAFAPRRSTGVMLTNAVLEERMTWAAGVFRDSNDFGSESALVYGPASLQGEYIGSWVNADASANPQYNSWYVYRSYFLTPGDHRRYKTAQGAFDKVTPTHPFMWGDDPGLGAWEVALRYSQLDLDDARVDGGELDDVTVGLNWYLNTNVRVMFNYILADLDDVGDTHVGAMRFQLFP